MKITSTFFQSCLIEATQNGRLLKFCHLQPPLAVRTHPPPTAGGLRLGLAWTLSTPGAVGLLSTPRPTGGK